MNDSEQKRRFERLTRAYGDDLYRFAVWLCRDPTHAADLVQETLLRAWRALHSLKDDKAAKSWLITILRREHARGFERKQLPISDSDETLAADSESGEPDHQVELAQFREAIMALEPNYREPLVLQVLMGLSIAEIANQLELTESAVMTRVFRAREQLKVRLERGRLQVKK